MIRVAFATTDGSVINEHFGRSGMFSIYEIDSEGYGFVETRVFAPGAHLEPGAARPSWSEKEPGAHLERPSWSDKKHGRDKAVEDTRGMGQIHDEVVQDKVEALSDCKILYVTEIGGPSAARLVRQNMMPVKVKAEIKIEDILRELLERIRTSPPPWLRKALQVD